MQHAAEVAQHLLRIKAVKLSPQDPFTWASGMLSPIYCDNRIALSHPDTRNFLKRCLAEAASFFRPFETVAGVATAGIAHGVLLADLLDLPFAYVRAEAKSHGRRNQIEGEIPVGSRVLVVEDLISTGGSSLKAIDALSDAGHEAVGVLAIFQYGFAQATAAFAGRRLPLVTLSDYDTLIREAHACGYVEASDLKQLEAWRANPDGWGALYA